MKSKLLLVAAFIFSIGQSFGQTTVFSDDFSTPDGGVGTTINTNSGTLSGGVTTYTAFNTAPGGFYTLSANGNTGIYKSATGTATTMNIQGSTALNASGGALNGGSYKGTTTISGPLSAYSAPFVSTLTNNTYPVTWTFNFRINKSTSLTPLISAFNPALAAGGAMILATDQANNAPITDASATSVGWAVTLTGGTSGDKIDLGYFSGGLYSDVANGTSTFTSILSADNLPITGFYSVKVVYDPTTDKWSLYTRADGSTTPFDPADGSLGVGYTLAAGSPKTETAYTTFPMTNFMFYFNHNVTNGAFWDNFKVVVDTPLKVSQNEISGLNVYPNPVSNGVVYIRSNSSDAKNVTVYDILGKQLIQKEVTNGSLDVSNLSKGVYLMKVAEGTASSTRKLVIE
jgi:hypothetical protein